ncbi:MAG: penicillin-binding protein activator LpoB [Treponema sp.]|nr:penicillin-binding protein activator LpoB [Treponema sp.]
MKKSGLRAQIAGVAGAFVLIGFLASCVSLEDKAMTARERQELDVIGSVTVEFTSFQFFHIPNKTNIRNKAYAELKKVAARKYGGNIDVRNIVISGGGSGWEALNIVGATALAGLGILVDIEMWLKPGTVTVPAAAIGFGIGNTQKITATGDVVLYRAASGPRDMDQSAQIKLQDAVAAISAELIETLPANAAIAVLSVGSNNAAISEAIVDELEFNLVRARRFTIVDRGRLDQIRREQNFQLSGDVSDDSAISIGSMLGAGVVIVGNVATDGSTGRITVRALDTQTAQIVTMSRGQF